jgi:hypothetical protein
VIEVMLEKMGLSDLAGKGYTNYSRWHVKSNGAASRPRGDARGQGRHGCKALPPAAPGHRLQGRAEACFACVLCMVLTTAWQRMEEPARRAGRRRAPALRTAAEEPALLRVRLCATAVCIVKGAWRWVPGKMKVEE